MCPASAPPLLQHASQHEASGSSEISSTQMALPAGPGRALHASQGALHTAPLPRRCALAALHRLPLTQEVTWKMLGLASAGEPRR